MMAACRVSENLEPDRHRIQEHEPEYTRNKSNDSSDQLPSVTVHDAKNLSIGGSNDKSSDLTSSSDGEFTPSVSTDSSPSSSPPSNGGGLALLAGVMTDVDSHGSHGIVSTSTSPSMSGANDSSPNIKTNSDSEMSSSSAQDNNFSCKTENFEDVSSNNNNVHVFHGGIATSTPTSSIPTKDKLCFHRRSLVRTSSSACSSISEDTEDVGSDDNDLSELSSSSSSSLGSTNSPRLRPPLQRTSAVKDSAVAVQNNDHPSIRCISPIGGPLDVDELETTSGIKTVVRRPPKSKNGRTSPSLRWSVMGVANGDLDAVSRATHHKGQTHPSHPPALTSSLSGGLNNGHQQGNGHSVLSRRSSFGLSATTTTALVSPRTKKLSTEFRRLSLQMDMPWRDPNERLVQFADWLIKRTEELMERSARARQKTYELLRLAKQRQKDRIEF